MTEIMGKLVVGLGNPGPRYQDTRHNIGFLVIDELLRRLDLGLVEDRAEYLASADALAGEGPVLMKPLTYMNLSGEAVEAWTRRAGVEISGVAWPPPFTPDPEDPEAPAPDPGPEPLRPLVICDDLALPLGAVRLRARGSSGGQNGVQSIIEHIGGEVFPRLRLGIAPVDAEVPPEFWPDYVLSEFEPEEHEAVREVVGHAADTVEYWLQNGTEATASRFNRRRPPVTD